MRTIVLVVVGLALALLATRLPPPAKRRSAALAFSGLWLAVTGWNLATGLSHGYSLGEELPIHAVIYLVPTAAAWLSAWTGRPT